MNEENKDVPDLPAPPVGSEFAVELPALVERHMKAGMPLPMAIDVMRQILFQLEFDRMQMARLQSSLKNRPLIQPAGTLPAGPPKR